MEHYEHLYSANQATLHTENRLYTQGKEPHYILITNESASSDNKQRYDGMSKIRNSVSNNSLSATVMFPATVSHRTVAS